MCYCIFVWNYQLQAARDAKFYKSSKHLMPIKFNTGDLKFSSPVICINGQLQTMLPLSEFMDRLEVSKKCSYYSFRSCDNQIEDENYSRLKKHIGADIKEKMRVNSTYWDAAQEIIRDRDMDHQIKKSKHFQSTGKISTKYQGIESPLVPLDKIQDLDTKS